MTLVVSYQFPGQGWQPRPPLDFVAHMTQRSGMSQTPQHAEIPSSDECVEMGLSACFPLHNPVVAD